MDAPIAPNIFDRLPDPTVILNGDGVIITLNQAASRLFEVMAARATGRRLDEFLPGLKDLATEQAANQPQRSVINWITSTKNRQLEIVISGWRNRQAEVAGFICVFHDLEFLQKNAALINQEQQHKTSQQILQLNQTLEKLETEYNLFTMVMDTMSVVVGMLDGEGKVTRFNRAFKLNFETAKGELIGQQIWDLLFFNHNGEPMSSTVQNLEQFLEQIATHETRLPTPEGELRVITWSSQAYTNSEDVVEHVIVTGIDITPQKKIEELLEREQILLRSLINSIPDLIFYKDTSGRYLGCNLAFEQFSSRSMPKVIVGHTDFDFYPPEVAEKFFRTDEHVMQTQETLIYENQINRPNGQRVILETRKSPYYGPHQEILGVIGIGRDITQHKLDEEALRQANAEIAQLIASLSSILIVVSTDLQVLHWNPSAEKILGLPAEEAVNRPLSEMHLGWDREAIYNGIEKCRREGAAQFLDPMRFKRKGGGEGWIGTNISPIYDQDKIINGFILLGSDITERKELENQVAQGQKLKSIGQLAAGIAHEINTPIQYIGDNTHFLQTSFADIIHVFQMYQNLVASIKKGPAAIEEIQHLEAAAQKADLDFLFSEIPLALEQSLDGIQRVSEIVRSMKEFSHPGVTYKTAVDINKGILNTITVARNEWKYVADVETDLAPDLPNVHCLPGEINQVLLNIIINAAQAIAENITENNKAKGKITVSSRHAGGWVEIRIKDSGPGIPENIQQHIFEPFFTTKEVGKGTGQGLAIAYNVIEVKHGGKLSYETRVGEGTTFIIRLPVQNQTNISPIQAS